MAISATPEASRPRRKPCPSPVAVPNFSSGGLLRIDQLEHLRRQPELKRDLKTAYGHLEAYQQGEGGQLIGWIDCLMTAFAETYVYRDLYMMVEAWEDEGGRLDVLDSLRRLILIGKSVSKTLTRYVHTFKRADACCPTMRFIQKLIDQFTLLINHHISGFRLEAEWTANARHRARYIRNGEIQKAKDAVFWQMGNPTPGRYCEARSKDKGGDQELYDRRKERALLQRDEVKRQKRIKHGSDSSYSEPESEVRESELTTVMDESHDMRTKVRNSNSGDDRIVTESIMHRLVSMSKESGISHDSGDGSKAAAQAQSEASTFALDSLPEEPTPPTVEVFDDHRHFIDHFLFKGLKNGNPGKTYDHWKEIKEMASRLSKEQRGRDKGYRNHRLGGDSDQGSIRDHRTGKVGRRAKSGGDGDISLRSQDDSLAVIRLDTSREKVSEENGGKGVSTFSLGTIGNLSDIKTLSLAALPSGDVTAGPPGPQPTAGSVGSEAGGTAGTEMEQVGSALRVSLGSASGSGSGDGSYASRNDSVISGTDDNSTGITSRVSSVGSSATGGSMTSLSLSKETSVDSASVAGSLESHERGLWDEHMLSKGSDTLRTANSSA